MMESLKIETPQGAALIACAGFLYDQVALAERAKLVTELMRQQNAGKAVVVSAQSHERLVAAIAAQIVPGKQAFVQSPRMLSIADDDTLVRLWQKLEEQLSLRGVDYIQAILPGEADGAILEHVGMKPIAKLAFLTAQAENAPLANATVEFTPYDTSQSDRMRTLIEQTYIDSADCPAVDGMRDMDDVIAGYLGAGVHDPANWFFVRRDGQDIGCLLLTDHPSANQYELVYMGLLVDARGQQLGEVMSQFAKTKTHAAGRERIHVAVDSENSPAIQTYTRSGFQLLQEQQVLAKSIAPSPPTQQSTS